jgi:hypothetical protein
LSTGKFKSDEISPQLNNRKSIIENLLNQFHADDSSFLALSETNSTPSTDVRNTTRTHASTSISIHGDFSMNESFD